MIASAGRIGVTVVGYGYWGPNMVRNVVETGHFRLTGVCERDETRASEARLRHPGIEVEPDFGAVLTDPRVGAVAIATPPTTHYPLVRAALEAGKHVLVEKPLATTSAHAAELIELADENGLVLMPGHTFLYSPSVNKVYELIREDVVGEVYFVTSSRMNLGKYQRDGVVWDLAPHDLSILSYWLGQRVVEVAASGRSVFQEGVPETAFLTLTFDRGASANVQISWLAPCKVRQMIVVGSRKMVQYEDTSDDQSVRVYDRGLDFDEPPSTFGEYRLTYRAGDMVVPRVEAAEPLALELEDFARAIRGEGKPRSSAEFGLEVVLALEALHESLTNGGAPVTVRSAADVLGGARAVPALVGPANGNGANGNGNGHGAHVNGNGNGAYASGNGAHANGNGNGAHANGNGHAVPAVHAAHANGNGNGRAAPAPANGNGIGAKLNGNGAKLNGNGKTPHANGDGNGANGHAPHANGKSRAGS
jgi:predicted dehydrogenase